MSDTKKELSGPQALASVDAMNVDATVNALQKPVRLLV
jgi:hypothetical protein